MSCKNEFIRQRAASCGCNNAETAAEPVSVPELFRILKARTANAKEDAVKNFLSRFV